jgi:hypothetical protein
MDQFIRAQNVARYRRLLERVTEESDRWHCAEEGRLILNDIAVRTTRGRN